MTRAASRERACSVARTVTILADAWSFLIIRESLFGAKRFDTFAARLGLPRGTLAERLKRLTEQGLLRQVPYSLRPPRYEYHLTRMGLSLYPSMIALLRFGDRWLADESGPPLTLIHKSCGSITSPIVACSACGEEVQASRVSYRDGPGAGTALVATGKRPRRTSDPDAFSRGRPCSVARTLRIIGDRWSFLILREAFFRTTRFDDLQANLRIAPNILAERLNRLVSEGVFARQRYQASPERFEYRLTPQGKDLYGPIVMMLRWGDRWLSGGEPPLVLTHRDCGADFKPTLICDCCRQPIRAREMAYRQHYTYAAARRPLMAEPV